MNIIRKFVKKNLKLNRKRAVVTVIGIILSVALLSALTSLVSSFQKSLVAYQKNKAGDYHVGFGQATAEDLEEFDNNRAIESYFTISEMGYGVIPESKNEFKPYCRIVGTDKNGMEQAHFEVIEGRLPENENEIVIPRHLKNNGRVEYKVGDTLDFSIGRRVDAADRTLIYSTTGYLGEEETLINLQQKTYKVVGIIERPAYGIETFECPGYTFVTYSENLSDDIAVYARLRMKSLRNFEVTVGGMMGIDSELLEKKYNSNEGLTDAEAAKFDDQLSQSKYNLITNQWLVQYERVWPIDNTFRIVLILAGIVAAIIIFTSVYCIKNSFDISITEKIRQYGMLSSIGATKRQIRKSVHTEAAILGCFGIPIGLISGLLAAFVLINISNYLLTASLSMDLVFYPSLWALIAAVILGVITIYFSAAGSARKAGKVSPMEAIRNQNEIAIKSKSIKAPKYVGKLFGIGGVISYKNIKRNRKKYRTTVVSIVICTVTFIVTSYFMSLGMDLVGFAYTEDDYNLSFDLHMGDEEEFDVNQITELEDYEELEITRIRTLVPENAVYTKEYKEYDSNYEVEEGVKPIRVMAIDDASFAKYAKECGIVNSEGTAILVNNNKVQWTDEDSDRLVHADLSVFDYNIGDKIELCDNETQDKYQIEISKTTDIRPTGYIAQNMTCFLVMSDSTAEQYNISFKNDYNFFFTSGNPDKLEDDIENIISNINSDNAGYSLYNRDKNQKEEKSLFLLFNIFAYGLITVIALIGITNIVNTLNTSMELRSREFATLRSVGMTDRQYGKMVLLETVFTAGKSLVLGIVIGVLITLGINWAEVTYDAVVSYRPPVKAIVISIVVVMGLIYAIIRAAMNRIIKRNIIETIKNENL